MKRVQYFVVLHENQWKISFDGKHYGPYQTQADAIEAARTFSLLRYKRPTEVLSKHGIDKAYLRLRPVLVKNANRSDQLGIVYA